MLFLLLILLVGLLLDGYIQVTILVDVHFLTKLFHATQKDCIVPLYLCKRVFITFPC